MHVNTDQAAAGHLDRIVIPDAELASVASSADPADRAQGLLLQQKKTWQLVDKGYSTLQSVRTRTFDFDRFQIKVQFNPGRLTSTAAKVDPNSIRERKCFLCMENLPPAQRGIRQGEDYLLLCNPFPIFPEHFTIPSLQHTPQRVLSSFGTLLDVTREIGSRYAVFYNGPKCGASAPDHLHFQAGNRSYLPLDTEHESLKLDPANRLFESGCLRAYAVGNYLRQFISFESSDAVCLQRAFAALYEVLHRQYGTNGDEPLLNIFGFFTQGQWRIVFFPRVRHRPSFYFKEGPEQLLVSPAAVEMAGVCTTPREQDFERITREHLVEMYNEVCVSADQFAALKASLAKALGEMKA
jgi:ATP adenylyltransferase/5',5'''-P-1,P-4-tetraphosphate phosphorylase II